MAMRSNSATISSNTLGILSAQVTGTVQRLLWLSRQVSLPNRDLYFFPTRSGAICKGIRVANSSLEPV